MDARIFRVNYKSDFIITLESDAGWATPFCIKFWTDSPQRAFYVQYDGETYTHCAPVAGEPTKLTVQMDDHNLGIGNLQYQIAYHFTVADFPNDTEDEVLNQAAVIINEDGQQEQVMLDFNGETAPEIEFSLPAYANEQQRIANEQQRIANEEVRIANEEQRIAAEQTRQQNEQQRISNEEARVSEFARLKRESEAATQDANEAAVLATTAADLASAKAQLAQDAATLANQKAQLAADKAALADSAATLATQKAQLAQEKATYAQTQGDYAKAQGTIAEADHVRAESDHTRAESDHAAVEVYVDSLGAFDISAYHATGGVLAKYADLTAALGTNGANIPDALRKGGMSVKFVQSSDNKYVQYRLMSDTFNTTVTDWQGVDDEPTAGSDNLVKSRGVYKEFYDRDLLLNNSLPTINKNVVSGLNTCTGSIEIKKGWKIVIKLTTNVEVSTACAVAIRNSDGDTVLSGATLSVGQSEVSVSYTAQNDISIYVSFYNSKGTASSVTIKLGTENTIETKSVKGLNTIDTTPTENSNNLVTSGGIKTALDAQKPTISAYSLLIGGNHTGITQGLVNINAVKNSNAAFENSYLAKHSIEGDAYIKFRISGCYYIYLLTDGWHCEQYIGTGTITLAQWRNVNNWLECSPSTIQALCEKLNLVPNQYCSLVSGHNKITRVFSLKSGNVFSIRCVFSNAATAASVVSIRNNADNSTLIYANISVGNTEKTITYTATQDVNVYVNLYNSSGNISGVDTYINIDKTISTTQIKDADTAPTEGSTNLVTSGGVSEAINNLKDSYKKTTIQTQTNIDVSQNNDNIITDYFDMSKGKIYICEIELNSAPTTTCSFAFKDISNNVNLCYTNVVSGQTKAVIAFSPDATVTNVKARFYRVGSTPTTILVMNLYSVESSNTEIGNNLYNKKIVLTGDSICYGVGFTGGYGKLIALRNKMSYQNIGIAGGTIAYRENKFCISRSIFDLDDDADYVLLEGGVNDSSLNITLGSITNGYTDEYDDTTFYGALEKMFKDVYDRFPGKKVGFIIVHQMQANYRVVNQEATSYYWAVVKCCEKWGIPYCDLNIEVPPFVYITSLRELYTDEKDGWHPNIYGYQKYYIDKIESFMRSL